MANIIKKDSDIRNVISSGNSTTILLGAGATFTGVWEDTVDYTSISISTLGSIATDGVLWFDVRKKGSTIVNSVPFFRTDISGNPTNIPAIWNVVEDEFRVRYVNGTTPQTGEWFLVTKYSNGQQAELLSVAGGTINANTPVSTQKAVLTGKDEDSVYHDVNVTRDGDLAVAITDSDLGFHAIVTPGGGLKVANQTHLVGQSFGNAALLTEKWDVDLVGSGTQDATIPGELSMNTGITADSTVKIQSEDIARFIPANYNTTHHAITLPDGASYAADNTRKWGAFDATNPSGNGIYYEIDDGVWYVVHCLNGVPTRIPQGSWTGKAALTFPTNSINANVYEIEYNAGSVIWRTNGQVIHRVTLLATPYADDIHFPVGMTNENYNGSIIDVCVKLRAAAIYTLGKGEGLARPHYISGTTAGVVVKDSPGKLDRVIISRSGAGGGDAIISIYDDTSAVGANQVGRIALDFDTTQEIDYNFTFNRGLFVVITGAGTLGTTITFD